MIGLNVSDTSFSVYKDIIGYDTERRYKKAKVDKDKTRKAKIKFIAAFIHNCKFLPQLYEKLGYSDLEMTFLRIDLIDEYLQRATKEKDLSYRRIIDHLYKDPRFWSFLIGLWLERDITFFTEKVAEVICITTGKKKLVYAEWSDTGFIELGDEEDLQFFYEAFHRRMLKYTGYECMNFIKGYIDKLEKYESNKMDKAVQGTTKKRKRKRKKNKGNSSS